MNNLKNAGWNITAFNEEGDVIGDKGEWSVYVMFFEPDSVMLGVYK